MPTRRNRKITFEELEKKKRNEKERKIYRKLKRGSKSALFDKTLQRTVKS